MSSEVTTSIINWRDLVLKAWGPDYDVPETAYRFSNSKLSTGREFKSTDNSNHGVYERS
jgi:hypothetical protein